MFPVIVKLEKVTKGCHTAIVNHEASIESLLKKGRYKYALPEICSKNFPALKKGEEQITAKVVYLNTRPVFGDTCFDLKMYHLEQKGKTPLDLREFLTVFNKGGINPNSVIYILGEIIECKDMLLAPIVRKTEYPHQGYVLGLEEV